MIVLLVGLATACVTRVLVQDVIAEPVRDWFDTRTSSGKLEYLINCPWCCSFHICLVLFVGAWAARGVALPPVSFLAAWQVGKLAYWATELLAAYGADRDA